LVKLKYFILLFCVAMWQLTIAQNAACTISVKGKVMDMNSIDALEDVSIAVLETQRGVLTDAFGKFQLNGLCKGKITLSVSHIGCQTQILNFDLLRDTTIKIKLDHTEVELNEVQVTEAKKESHSTQQVGTLETKELEQLRGLSLGESLSKISGVTTINTGASISKPVIHGLHSNRILILNNGVRLEGQQWGSEHAPEIDPFMAQKLSVIKGASSLQYGSDAIGGVILVEPNHLPVVPGIGGEFNFAGYSNNAEGNFSATLEGNHAKIPAFSWRVQGTYKRGGNVRSPNYWQKNTGVEEGDFSVALGWKKENYGFEVFYSRFQTKIGILSASHLGNLNDLNRAIQSNTPLELSGFSYNIGRPYQDVSHDMIKARAYVKTGKAGSLDIVFARQFNLRKEYDKHLPYNNLAAKKNLPGFQFQIQTITLDLIWQHRTIKNFSGTVGFNGMTQTNEFKYGYFIPAFWNFSGGVFAIEKWRKRNMEFEAGIRLDYKWLQVFLNHNGEKGTFIFNYVVPSSSVGMEYHINEKVKWNANLGTAWRAPQANELFANGLHHGAATVEIGDKTLKPELAYNFTTGIQANTKYFDANIGLYENLISRFIYLQPVLPSTLTIRGEFPTYHFKQSNVSLTGTDIDLTAKPIKGLELFSKTSLLFAYNLTTADWQIQMPPQRFENGIRYTLRDFKRIKETYFGISFVNVLQQKLIPQNDTDYAVPPKAYWLLNFEAGFKLQLKKQAIHFSVTVTNMANIAYRDYLDRFRYFTDKQGVNAALRIRVPFFFQEKLNQKSIN
jgi:iron complex outermembrane receptor protein